MQVQLKQLQELLCSFDFPYAQILGQTYKIDEEKSEDDKKLKKKLKKYGIQESDSVQTASQKVSKMLQEFAKNYQNSAKAFYKISDLKKTVDQSQKQRDNSFKMRQLAVNVSKKTKTNYEEELKKAQEVEKEEEDKRKKTIEELQQRIKNIQTRYEETGKSKLQNFRENQTLKHETSKLQPHLIASESLYDAQLKKKSIEIEIQMTTLKQKIQMMDNFKGMKTETVEKIQKGKIQELKINSRLKRIGDKEDEHKILLAKAHLVFQEYKKAINTLKTVLPKKQKQALQSRSKAGKAEASLKQLKKSINDLDIEIQNQVKQKQVLETLQNNLTKQLQEGQ